jgi:hypothetical protein
MDFDGLLLKVYIMLILKIDDYLYNVPKTRIAVRKNIGSNPIHDENIKILQWLTLLK